MACGSRTVSDPRNETMGQTLIAKFRLQTLLAQRVEYPDSCCADVEIYMLRSYLYLSFCRPEIRQ